MLECPHCHSQGPDEDAPPEVFRQKFYRLKHPGYYVCLECNRRFSEKSHIRVS